MGRLAIAFGLLALMLVPPLCGTLAYRVSRRTAEIGLRMALGAGRTRVLAAALCETRALAALSLIGVFHPNLGACAHDS
jgi:macrolide transport system ATP-binding/permease protein